MSKKILLAVGITLLFLGVYINPAIAINPISTDNEDDCDICPKVNKLQEVEKYRELFDRITTLTEMNKELNPDRDYPIICDILYVISAYQLITIIQLANFVEDYYSNNKIISSILSIWGIMKGMIGFSSSIMLGILNCPQYPILKNNWV